MAFSYYKSMTLAESQSGTADSTDWPLTVALDGNVQAVDADFKTVGNGGYVQNSSGYDIRPYSDSALTTPLTFELVYYNATTGAFEMHIKIPTLSTSTDTVIYMAFGDSGISTDGSSTSTWNSSFKGVFHLKDGTTLAVTDSSQTGNNGTNNGATATTGQIDGGASFNGTNQTVDLGTTNVPIRSAITVSGWFKTTAATAKILSRWDDATAGLNWLMIAGTNDINVYAAQANNNAWNATATGMTSGAWTFIAFASSGSNAITLYKNDDSPISGSNLFPTPGVDGPKVVLGAGQNGTGYVDLFNGQADEIRISDSVRSTSWMTADYNSQKASSTFITWGARTSTGGSVTIKSKKGLAQASIKSYKGLATASVKSDKGLSNV